jgi:hypothetical protein
MWLREFNIILVASQNFYVPSLNITIDEVMILFTGRSVHIIKMKQKPIDESYKFYCLALADKGYI